jgi:hypothetical protein
LFVDDARDRPDEIVVDELTLMDAGEFVDRLEAIAAASEAIDELTAELAELRQTGLADEDLQDLIYGRNRACTKSEIEAVFEAIDELESGRADRPMERLLSGLTGYSLTECEEILAELELLHAKYGDRDE